MHMCIFMCVEVVLINILASHLTPQTKIPDSVPALSIEGDIWKRL